MKNDLPRNLCIGSAFLPLLLLAGCAQTPVVASGPLTPEEERLTGSYILRQGGLKGEKDEEISRRLERQGTAKKDADKYMSDLRSTLKIPDVSLLVKKDRSFTLTSGKSTQSGKWTGTPSTLSLIFDSPKPTKAFFDGPRVEAFEVGQDRRLTPKGGGAAFEPAPQEASM